MKTEILIFIFLISILTYASDNENCVTCSLKKLPTIEEDRFKEAFAEVEDIITFEPINEERHNKIHYESLATEPRPTSDSPPDKKSIEQEIKIYVKEILKKNELRDSIIVINNKSISLQDLKDGNLSQFKTERSLINLHNKLFNLTYPNSNLSNSRKIVTNEAITSANKSRPTRVSTNVNNNVENVTTDNNSRSTAATGEASPGHNDDGHAHGDSPSNKNVSNQSVADNNSRSTAATGEASPGHNDDGHAHGDSPSNKNVSDQSVADNNSRSTAATGETSPGHNDDGHAHGKNHFQTQENHFKEIKEIALSCLKINYKLCKEITFKDPKNINKNIKLIDLSLGIFPKDRSIQELNILKEKLTDIIEISLNN